MINNLWRILVLAGLGFMMMLPLGATSRAAFVVNMTESGGDVIATGSGTINTAGLQFYQVIGNVVSLVDAGKGNVILGDPFPSGADVDAYQGITGPTDFGSDSPFWFADEGGGDTVGVTFPLAVTVPVGYISGSSLSSNATWFSKTLTDLGLTPGTSYTWTWGSGDTADSFTLNIGAQAVPEPSSLVLLGGGALALIGHAWRRRAIA
jgi:hypothetical protein